MKLEFDYHLTDSSMHEAYVADSVHEVRMDVWYVTDALGELARNVVHLLRGGEYAYCVWEDDPGEHKWVFRRDGEVIHIKIIRFESSFNGYGFPDERGTAIFETDCALAKFALKLRNELRQLRAELGLDEYRRRARARFPEADYGALRSLLSARKAGEVTGAK